MDAISNSALLKLDDKLLENSLKLAGINVVLLSLTPVLYMLLLIPTILSVTYGVLPGLIFSYLSIAKILSFLIFMASVFLSFLFWKRFSDKLPIDKLAYRSLVGLLGSAPFLFIQLINVVDKDHILVTPNIPYIPDNVIAPIAYMATITCIGMLTYKSKRIIIKY